MSQISKNGGTLRPSRRRRFEVPDAERVVSPSEAADFLGISPTSLRRLLGHEIPYHRPFGRKIAVKLVDLRAYRASRPEVGIKDGSAQNGERGTTTRA